MKWVLRFVAVYLGVVAIVFGGSFAASYFSPVRSLVRAIDPPTVGIAFGDDVYTNEISFFDQDFYGFDWVAAQPEANVQTLDIILIPLERWAELETSPAIRGLGLLGLTLRDRPLPDEIIRTRTTGIVLTWSWLPLQVRSRELVVFDARHFGNVHRQECIAELFASIAVDRLDEDFRQNCRQL